MAVRLPPRTLSPRRLAWMYHDWNVLRLQKVNIFLRRSRRKVGVPRTFLPSLCREKLLLSTGPRTCTGESRVSVLCVQCAGWSRCSTIKLFRWSSGESAQEMSRVAIESSQKARSEFRKLALHTLRYYG